MRKNLVTIYTEDDWEVDTPLESSPETKASFEDFYTYANSIGVDVFRANIEWYDPHSQSFLKAWTYRDEQWMKISESVKPDAVFDKLPGRLSYPLFDLKMSMPFPVVNSPMFRAALDNKLSQYLAFRNHMPTTYLAKNIQEAEDAAKSLSGDTVVLKQPYGSGGKQVEICEKSEIKNTSLTFPIIVQQFVPTAGVPGISDQGEVADLRIVYIGEAPMYALSRKAEEGSLFTNFHRGASAIAVPWEAIPENCRQMASAIVRDLSVFRGENISLDFMFTTEGAPIFIEMNTTPGFDLLRIVGDRDMKERYFNTLLNSFFVGPEIGHTTYRAESESKK